MSVSGRVRFTLIVGMTAFAMFGGTVYTQNAGQGAQGRGGQGRGPAGPVPNADILEDGKFLEEWKQFGRVSGLAIDRNDTLYAIDSESNETRHPGWKTGVRIWNTKENKVLAFIVPHPNDKFEGAAGERIAVDRDGNVYGAEGPISRPFAGGGLTKYVKR
jgi:hypothetical protein